PAMQRCVRLLGQFAPSKALRKFFQPFAAGKGEILIRGKQFIHHIHLLRCREARKKARPGISFI
ncbi:MAG: hypothetical protein WBW89_14505, partial [Candidatus Cybelea sp.]